MSYVSSVGPCKNLVFEHVKCLRTCHTANCLSSLHRFCELLHLVCHGSMLQTQFSRQDFPSLIAICEDAAFLAFSDFLQCV